MRRAGENRISKQQRRRAFAQAYANGALWSLGNGLASTSLIVYLARQLGAAGLGIGAILAAPHIAGVLRLAAPAIVARTGSKRAFCVTAFGGSALLLAAISQLAQPGRLRSETASLTVVIALWCIYHLLEYAATAVLWSWLGDLVPRRIRGRFIGAREGWMMLARIVGMLAGGGFSAWWLSPDDPPSTWVAYALPTCLGAACMMTALVPLLRMPEIRGEAKELASSSGIRILFAPLGDARMRWLLAFGIWFSFANGLTNSAQYLFPIVALSFPLWARNALDAGMRLGQAALAGEAGRYADRHGSRPLLIVSQLIVAFGLLFFVITSYEARRTTAMEIAWLLCGAWVAWIAYVGLNVGLPHLMLKLAGPQQRASYVAWYFAVTGVVYGLSTIAGGAIYEWLSEQQIPFRLVGLTFNHVECLFLVGFTLRLTAIVWLLPIAEPGVRGAQKV
jgi:MFS family permease